MPDLKIVKTSDDFHTMLEIITDPDHNIIGADTETTGLKWYSAHVIGHCFGCLHKKEWYGFYLPVRHQTSACGIEPENYDQVGLAEAVLQEKVYGNEDIAKVWFNKKFDINMLQNHGITSRNNEDCMFLMFLRNENERNHQLKTLAAKYLGKDSVAEADDLYAYSKKYKIFKGGGTYANVPIEILGPYGAKDPCLTLALWNKFRVYITPEQSKLKDGLRLSIYEHENAFAGTVGRLERQGFPIDPHVLEELEPLVEKPLGKLLLHLHTLADIEFNPESDKDVRMVMAKLGHKPFRTTPKGSAAWGRDELMRSQSEIGECLASFRNLSTILTNYIRGLRDWVHKGRIHCSYNQIGARTGRASASEPPMQGIPKRFPKYTRIPEYVQEALQAAMRVREAFRAPDGYSILSIDESQFELRILDHFAQDPNMHEAFLKGYDVHSYVASILFNIPYVDFISQLETDTSIAQKRDITKNTNFGILYGAGKKRIQNQLAGSGIHMTLTEVSQFWQRYMETFSEIKSFVNSVQSTVRRRGYVFNHYGRHKRVPANRAYVGVNYLIQGLTADMLKEGMMRTESITDYGKTKLMLAVHDEIDFLLHEDEHKLIPILKRTMEDFPWSKTPIVADVEIGPSWGEMEKWHE